MTKTSPPLHRLYEAAAYDTATWPDSHWRATAPALPACPALEGAARADVAIIGAGFAGLSAALRLAQAGAEVVVVEAAQPGWGASGRNGGFCCMGGAKLSPGAIARRFGQAGADRFEAMQAEAVAFVADTLARHRIDAREGPDGEYCIAHSARAWRKMQRAGGGQLLSPQDLARRGMDLPWAKGALFTPVGFPLNPMAYVQGLARAAQGAGARVHGDSPALSVTPQAGGWQVRTATGAVAAKQVLIATNGYSAETLPGWFGGRLLPVLSSILVTRPLSAAEQAAAGWTGQQMAYDSRTLLHYFRLLPDNRMLFGMRGAVRATPAALEHIHAQAQAHLARMFPALAGIAVAHHWSGLICLTGSLLPYAGPVPGAAELFAAVGWHGNGVALASLSGARIADEMLGREAMIPEVMRQPPPRFPLPRYRRTALAAAYAAARLRDGPLP